MWSYLASQPVRGQIPGCDIQSIRLTQYKITFRKHRVTTENATKGAYKDVILGGLEPS